MHNQHLPTGRLAALQALRAIAANLVVICHIIGLQSRFYPDMVPYNGFAALLGRLGVDCFFVISGFVVTRAAMREDWQSFVVARVSRIFPIYWIYPTVTILFVVVWQRASIGLDQLFASVLLLATAPQIMPVAWSLVFEAYFYAVLAGVLIVGTNLFWSYAVWAVAVFAASIAVPHSFIGSLMPLEFVVGGLLALSRGPAVDYALTAIPAPQWLQRLGDASYSIYLCHFLIIAALGRALFWIMPEQKLLAAAACFIVANLTGLASYWWLEQPILKASKTILRTQLTRQRSLGMRDVQHRVTYPLNLRKGLPPNRND